MASPEPVPALSAQSTDGQARRVALTHLPPSLSAGPDGCQHVTYRSHGRVLVVGAETTALAAAERLQQTLEVYVLLTDAADEAVSHPDVGPLGERVLRAQRASTLGHLGAFQLQVRDRGTEVDLATRLGLDPGPSFDLLLDLDDAPGLTQEKPPPGYFAPRDADTLEQALAELPELIGEFDKPRYFDYRFELCAHGARGQTGCTRCLEACAAEAIRPNGDGIEVDPYLCQGCGSCATVCPSGAISYAWPPAETLIDALRTTLRQYREHGGSQPTLLFHDGEAGAAAVTAWAGELPESALPVAVEDVGAIGPETCLAALAYGAGAVRLLLPPTTPPSEREATLAQIGHAEAMLGGLGYPAGRIEAIGTDDGPETLTATEPLVADPATFAGLGGKRAVLRHALAHLHAHAPAPVESQPLAPGAAHGTIEVDGDACTLCMACVSVCPPGALIGGGDEPRLLLREDRCVQCGLCDTTCPEDAINLVPRMNYRAHLEPAEVVLSEEPMHHCPGCGKAFATRKVIELMEQRLAGHWMFQDEKSRQRLYLCEDCRVRAAMSDQHGINPYG